MSDAVKIMFVMRKAPYGSRFAHGGLEAALVIGAYEQEISFLFLDDGVYNLKKGMDTSGIKIKNFSPTFLALEGYDIDKLYIVKESMEKRGLTLDDLILQPEVVDKEEVAKLMESQHVLLPF